MSEHSFVQDSLYDYVMDDLASGERDRVEHHLQQCQECTHDLENLQELVGLIPRPPVRPSTAHSDSYWETAAATIEARIRREEQAAPAPGIPRLAELLDLVWNSRKPLSLAAGALAVAAVAIVLLMREPPPPMTQAPPSGIATVTSTADTQDVRKMTQYLRRSKNLLVGLSNMKTRPESPGDMAAERDISRRLLQDARSLRERAADPRAVELLDDIDGILVKVAGADEAPSLPDIDLLRRGIREQNLLFKVRMAETALQSTMTASYRKQQQ